MASCPTHALSAEQHCEEMELMLEEIPGDFCEGEGDMPHDAVKRLANAYWEAVHERDGYRSAMIDLHDAARDTTISLAAIEKARKVLKDGPATPTPGQGGGT